MFLVKNKRIAVRIHEHLAVCIHGQSQRSQILDLQGKDGAPVRIQQFCRNTRCHAVSNEDSILEVYRIIRCHPP